MPVTTAIPQTVWGWLIIIYLFIAGVGAGAYLTAWWAGVRGLSERVSRIGRYIAPVLVIVGTGMLFFDLGAGFSDPVRIFGLYTHPSSMMTLGTWILTIFAVLSIIDGYGPLVKIRRFPVLSAITAVFALFLAIYTGLLLGVNGSVPLWNNALLPVLFVVSALSTGMAATLLCAVIVSRKGEDAEKFGRLHIAVIVIEAAVAALFLFFAAKSQAPAANWSFDAIISGQLAGAFWIGFVVIGLVVPLVYNLIALSKSLSGVMHSPALVAIECLCVLAGGLMLRYIIVTGGAIDHFFVS